MSFFDAENVTHQLLTDVFRVYGGDRLVQFIFGHPINPHRVAGRPHGAVAAPGH